MSKKREYDEEYKMQAIELAKNLSGNPMESPKLTGKHANLMIFWNVILQQMHLWKNALQTLLKSRQKTESCMFRRFLTAMIWCQMVLPWQIICELNCAVKHWKNASLRYPEIRGAIVHSDRGSQYTSSAYRTAIQKYGIVQSMNSAGGRCHDNARCESIWARMKEELFYNRGRRSEDYTIKALKTMVWRYFMSYWSNRRICSAIGGLPPAVKRRRFYSALTIAA